MKSATVFVMSLAVSFQLACGMEASPTGNEASDPAMRGAAPEDSQLASQSSSLAAPTASLSCSQSVTAGVECIASASGGVPPYTYFWGQYTYVAMTNRTYSSLMYEGSPTHGPLGSCYPPSEQWPMESRLRVKLYVVDSM